MLPPSMWIWKAAIANGHPAKLQEETLNAASCDSGRSYFELILWFLDTRRAAYLEPKKIQTPVLVFGGENDRTVNPRIAKRTAELYPKGVYLEIPLTGHLMIVGEPCADIMGNIDRWLSELPDC